jgi:hypothetical protein
VTAAGRERLLSLLEGRAPDLVGFTWELIATPSPNVPGDEIIAASRIYALTTFEFLRC